MKDALISVLMSVFDTDFITIKRAIDSVLSQDYQNFELIIIDDGSHNDLDNELLNYAKSNENKITYLRHANRGQSASINRGVLNSSGDFIAIIDGDDEYKSNHLSSCLEALQGFDLISSTAHIIAANQQDYFVPDKKDSSHLIHVDQCILFGTLFGKKDVFSNIKFIGNYAADSQFYESASKFYAVNKVDLRTYVYYRNNPNSAVAKLKSTV